MTLRKLKVQAKNRKSDYVCFDCGREYLTAKQILDGAGAVTAHIGTCGICSGIKAITHIRAFNWLKIIKNE